MKVKAESSSGGLSGEESVPSIRMWAEFISSWLYG